MTLCFPLFLTKKDNSGGTCCWKNWILRDISGAQKDKGTLARIDFLAPTTSISTNINYRPGLSECLSNVKDIGPVLSRRWIKLSAFADCMLLITGDAACTAKTRVGFFDRIQLGSCLQWLGVIITLTNDRPRYSSNHAPPHVGPSV